MRCKLCGHITCRNHITRQVFIALTNINSANGSSSTSLDSITVNGSGGSESGRRVISLEVVLEGRLGKSSSFLGAERLGNDLATSRVESKGGRSAEGGNDNGEAELHGCINKMPINDTQLTPKIFRSQQLRTLADGRR